MLGNDGQPSSNCLCYVSYCIHKRELDRNKNNSVRLLIRAAPSENLNLKSNEFSYTSLIFKMTLETWLSFSFSLFFKDKLKPELTVYNDLCEIYQILNVPAHRSN